MRILAIDLGTSSLKILRMAGDGQVEAIDRVPMSGLDIDAWIRAIGDNVRAHGDGDHITAMSLTGQMHGLMTRVDNARRGIGIPWHDQRSAQMLPELRQSIGAEAELGTGGPLAAGFLAASLAWVRQHDPDHWNQISAVSLPKDSLIHELTGAHVTDPSDAVGTGLLDVHRGDWAWPVIDALEIPHRWLPRIIPSGTVAGTLTASAARQTALPEGIPVIAAGGDAPVGAFGAGIRRENDALIMLSTGAQLIRATSHAGPDPEGRWYTWPSVAPEDGGFLNVGTLLNAGNVTTWAVRSLRNSAMPDRPTGLLALPHLIGTRANPGRRAAIIGVTEATSPGEIRRALIEGIGYSLRVTLDGMIGNGPRPARIRIGGGLAQAPLNRQILADVLGVALEHIDQAEVTAYGAGLLALHTLTGSMPDDASAPASVTTPTADDARQYDDLYSLYREADDAIAAVTERLSSLASDHSQ